MALQHLRSSTANKRPTPGVMSDGQLAMNTNLVSPGLFLKDSNGDLVKVGPVHVGTTAPNATPGAGGQAGNSKGEQWLDTSSSRYVFKIWDGTAWRTEDGEFVNISGDTMTGALGIIAGSAATPGVFFSGDPNTGVYSPGADQVAVATNGQQSLVVDENGAVVIKRGPLVLGPTGEEGGQLEIRNPLGTGSVYILDAPNATSARLFTIANDTNLQIGQVAGTGGTVQFATGGTERLRITSAGLVGIGTSAPSDMLSVVKTDTSNSLFDSDAAITITNPNSDAFGRSTNLNFNQGADASSGRLASIAGVYTTFSTSVGGAIAFSTNNGSGTVGEKMRITSAGNVGIGTTSPGARLQINESFASPGIKDVLRLQSESGVDGAVLRIGGYGYTGNARSAIDFIQNGATNFASQIVLSTSSGGETSERARIDSSGNVGIGTSNPAYLLDVNGRIRGISVSNALLASNGSGSGQTSIGLRREGGATDQKTWEIFTGESGEFKIRTINDTYTGAHDAIAIDRGSGLSVNSVQLHTNGSERLRIDSSGRLLVGTSSALLLGSSLANFAINNETLVGAGVLNHNIGATRHGGTVPEAGPVICLARSRGTTIGAVTLVANGDTLGILEFSGADGTDFGTTAANIKAAVDGTPGANDMPGRLVFSTTADGASSPTERMRIGSIGYLKASNTGAYTDASGGGRSTTSSHFFRSDQNAPTVLATNTNTSNGVEGFTSDFPAGATGNHFIGANAISRVFIVAANGNVTNTNNSYGAISDIKLKENIVDANSQWGDLKALQVRNYNFKEGQTHTQIGLVAQEAELVSPGLVTESPDLDAEGNDLGTVTKSVNYSVLYMKAVKALQEAMERIEQLEQRLTDAGIA